MILNYIKITYRSFLQNKVYTVVNIAGLTVAIAVCMLIVLYIKDDLSFDRFHANGRNIYRLVADVADNHNEARKTGNTGHIQGPIFLNEIPEITSFCRIKNGWNTIVKKGNDGLIENMIYADSSFLTMFSFDVIYGDSKTALIGKNKIIITDETALKYFNKIDVVGSVLNIDDEGENFKPFEISAVVKKIKSNSSIQFDICGSFTRLKDADEQYTNSDSWINSSLNTFFTLTKDANSLAIDAKLKTVTDRYLEKEFEVQKGADKNADSYTMDFHLQPLFNMHLDPEYFATNGLEHWSNAKYPKIMAAFAIILLLIASINFINLALARSLVRTKEIGIRKTLGGTRLQLFFQFLSEAFLITLAAILPALLLAHFLLPSFSELTNKYFEPSILFAPYSLLFVFVIALVIALISGGYPAFVMSSFLPIEGIKGKTIIGNKQKFKKGLVVFQFSTAAILMIGTAFINQQFDYIQSKPLGYDTNERLRFWLPWEQISKISQAFKQDLSKISYIKNVSGKSGDYNKNKGRINGQETEWIYFEHIDDHHLQLMNIPLTAGRYLSYEYALDTVSNVIVNESFVKKYFAGENPFSESFQLGGQMRQIVGITKDFHYSSFKEKIEPLAFYLDKNTQGGCIHVQYQPGHLKETLASIASIYKKYVPYLPLECQSLDDFRMEQYAEEVREKKIINYTALIAIFIACLGLFGLATFITEQRVKEISIRKVFGASIASIVSLLTADFVKLVIIAFVIAIPISYYFTHKWLEDFTYRIEINWWVFLVTFLITSLLSLCTVSYNSIKTALINPAKVLRSE